VKVVLFLSLFFVLFSRSWSSTLEAEFAIDNKITSLKEGDVVTAVLRVWPIEEVDEAEFRKLQTTTLFDSFYLAEIESIAPSVNNADVIELKGSFVVTGKINPSKLSINYHDQLIHVRFKEVLINQLETKINQFYIEEQDIDHNYLNLVLIFGAIVLLVIMYVKRERLKLLIKKPEKTDDKLIYSQMFKQAKNREDYEAIYLQKDRWMKLLVEVTPAHHDFFKILNEHQYKKDWNQNIKKEVEESFEQIRRSF